MFNKGLPSFLLKWYQLLYTTFVVTPDGLLIGSVQGTRGWTWCCKGPDCGGGAGHLKRGMHGDYSPCLEGLFGSHPPSRVTLTDMMETMGQNCGQNSVPKGPPTLCLFKAFPSPTPTFLLQIRKCKQEILRLPQKCNPVEAFSHPLIKWLFLY